LNEAARERHAIPTGELDDVASLFSQRNDEVRGQAFRLAGAWKLKQCIPPLLEVAGNESRAAGLRQAAFDGLRDLGGDTVIARLQTLCTGGRDAAVRRQAILTLAALDLQKAGQPAVTNLLELTSETDAAEFWRALLQIKGAAATLAGVLPKTGLPPVIAKAGLRVAREGGRHEPELVWALTRGADLEGEAQALSADEIQQLASKASAAGDAARGERIFRRKELGCVTCHAIGGVGGKVGPDLTSMGASAPMDYLIESVFYPNRKIKEGYQSVIIETKDGQELSGVLAREESERVVLRDATDKEISVSKDNIQSRTTGNSLMPAGLIDFLSASERLDLFRFLSELGKPGPFDASKPTVARSWKLFAYTLDAAQFGDEKALQTKLSDAQWRPAHSQADGRLLKEEFSAALDAFRDREPRAVYAAAQFEVAKAGPVAFKLTGADGSPVWVDGKPAPASDAPAPDLSAGAHTIILKLDANKLPDAIRVESPDATFLAD